MRACTLHWAQVYCHHRCVFLFFFFSLNCIVWFLWEKGEIDRKELVEYITSGFCQKYHLATFLLSLTCRLWFVDTIISMHGYQYAAGHIRVPLHNFLNPPLELCVHVCVCSFLRGINKILKKIIYLRNGRINTDWTAINGCTYLMMVMGMIRRLPMVHICVGMSIVLCHRTWMLKWTRWLNHHIQFV